jgi:DNA-binding response OmpR family regulator
MKKNKILIVEDESLVALDIQECLQTAGYEVVGMSPNGKDALRLIEDKHPNLVIMDIILGKGMDGIETAWAIRIRFGLPLIFLTALKDQATLVRAGLAQPHGYIVKPFQESILLNNVEMSLRGETNRRYPHRKPPWLGKLSS